MSAYIPECCFNCVDRQCFKTLLNGKHENIGVVKEGLQLIWSDEKKEETGIFFEENCAIWFPWKCLKGHPPLR